MIIAVLLWIILIAIAAAFIAPKVKDRNIRRGMKDNIKTVHGFILPGTWDYKDTHSVSYAGFSVSSSGNITNYYQPHSGSNISGFIVHFACDGSDILKAHQLPNSNQDDPFYAYSHDRRKGTLSYVTDKNGKHYYIDFTPD